MRAAEDDNAFEGDPETAETEMVLLEAIAQSEWGDTIPMQQLLSELGEQD